MSDSIERFRRHVQAAQGIYHRIDSGLLTGRNSASTDATLDAHVEGAKAILAAACKDAADPLPEYLEGRGARLAQTWNRIERRHYGLRP